jgi:hypothetical protein
MIFAFQPPVSDAAVDWALAYAAAGIAVFPCRADKKPLTEHGCLDATTDPDQIRAWWERWRYAEIGWAVPACVVVVDLDRKPGADGLRDFFEHEGVEAEAVETPIAVTPSGGRHLVFDAKGAPYRNGVRVNGSAIDVRTSGGYVVLPRSGNGRWWLKPLSTPLAPAAGLAAYKAHRAPSRRGEAFHRRSAGGCAGSSPVGLSRNRDGHQRRSRDDAQQPLLPHRPPRRRGATRGGPRDRRSERRCGAYAGSPRAVAGSRRQGGSCGRGRDE